MIRGCERGYLRYRSALLAEDLFWIAGMRAGEKRADDQPRSSIAACSKMCNAPVWRGLVR